MPINSTNNEMSVILQSDYRLLRSIRWWLVTKLFIFFEIFVSKVKDQNMKRIKNRFCGFRWESAGSPRSLTHPFPDRETFFASSLLRPSFSSFILGAASLCVARCGWPCILIYELHLPLIFNCSIRILFFFPPFDSAVHISNHV